MTVTSDFALAISPAARLFLSATLTVNGRHHGYSMFIVKTKVMGVNNNDNITFYGCATFHSSQLRWRFDALDIVAKTK